jgi:hypothetical protein
VVNDVLFEGVQKHRLWFLGGAALVRPGG